MLASLKLLFRISAPAPTRFVPPDQLTAFQMRSWHKTAPIALTERKMEALVLFFARSLMKRWSFLEASQAEDGTPRYIVLLEAETESGLFEAFRALADSPASEARLSRS